MTTSLQEAAAGATQKQLEQAIIEAGKNPDDYVVYPFALRPFVGNPKTKKRMYIDDLLAGKFAQ